MLNTRRALRSSPCSVNGDQSTTAGKWRETSSNRGVFSNGNSALNLVATQLRHIAGTQWFAKRCRLHKIWQIAIIGSNKEAAGSVRDVRNFIIVQLWINRQAQHTFRIVLSIRHLPGRIAKWFGRFLEMQRNGIVYAGVYSLIQKIFGQPIARIATYHKIMVNRLFILRIVRRLDNVL